MLSPNDCIEHYDGKQIGRLAVCAGADCRQDDVPEQKHTSVNSRFMSMVQAVLVGSDIPDLDASILMKAFDVLERHEASAAPARQR